MKCPIGCDCDIKHDSLYEFDENGVNKCTTGWYWICPKCKTRFTLKPTIVYKPVEEIEYYVENISEEEV